MEMKEEIAMGRLGPEWKCPLDHKEKTQMDLTNDFKGYGSKLGTNLGNAKSTAKKSNYRGSLEYNKNPSKRGGHIFEEFGEYPIYLFEDNGKLFAYQLTCAAHHLIPAQASLKMSSLLPFLCKKGTTPQVLTSGEPGDAAFEGCVQEDVGYDVNGAENGIWLPGSYAMRGMWKGFPEIPDDENENPPDEPKVRKVTKSQRTLTDKPTSQLDYAIVAMKLANCQFHDAHQQYSNKVTLSLDLHAARMAKVQEAEFCEDCKEAIEKEGSLPPPYHLLLKLNSISNRLMDKLTGAEIKWAWVKGGYFTSGKVNDYMADQKRNPWQPNPGEYKLE